MEISPNKWKVVSDVSRDIALVFFASVFLGPLLSSESANSLSIAAGLILSIILWGVSFLAVK